MKSAWWKTALKYGLGLALLAYVLWSNWAPKNGQPGLRDALDRPLRFGPLALAAILLTANVLLTFLRWYLLVRAQDLPFTVRSALRLGLVGYFFNTFLPGSVGGDLLKATFIAREHERRTKAVATVLIDRGIGLWGLIALTALLGAGFWLIQPDLFADRPDLKSIVRTAGWMFAVTLGMWTLLCVLPERRGERFAQRLNWIPRIGGMLAEFWRAVWIYRTKSRVIFVALVLSLIGHTCSVLNFYLAAQALRPEDTPIPPLALHFLIVPVGMVVQGFFPAPGGVGGGELAYGKLYVLLGFTESTGVLGSLGVRLLSWCVGSIGYIVYSFMKKEIPAPVLAAAANP